MSFRIPLDRKPSPSQIARFWKRVTKTDGCWTWNGLRVLGYGRLSIYNEVMYAHRLSYELCVGPIPKGKEIDHICWNRACVRPDHLRAVSHKINVNNRAPGHTFAEIAARKRQTHCKYGHEFTPENTSRLRNGERACRACVRRRALAYYHRHQEELRRRARERYKEKNT